MDERAVLLQPAFILQHRNFRESSLIMDVLTRDFGVVSVVAKGVRKNKSKTSGVLVPFSELRISFVGRTELRTLTASERMSHYNPLFGVALFCGYYVNELICHFLHRYDPHPDVYALYKNCLNRLSQGNNVELTLRLFELELLAQVGYALVLTHDALSAYPVIPGKRYSYRSGSGITSSSDGCIDGKTLLALAEGSALNENALAEAKQLMRLVVDDHLQGKALKSRAVLANVIKYLQ